MKKFGEDQKKLASELAEKNLKLVEEQTKLSVEMKKLVDEKLAKAAEDERQKQIAAYNTTLESLPITLRKKKLKKLLVILFDQYH